MHNSPRYYYESCLYKTISQKMVKHVLFITLFFMILLYPLMLTKYFLPTFTKEGIVVNDTMKILTNRIFKLEKLK
jgi:hypothetical protein